MPGRPWTEHETKRARDMYAAGRFYGEIDRALGRRAGATKRRLEGLGRTVRSSRVPDTLAAERDALTAAREQRALTEFLWRPAPRLLGATRQNRSAITQPASPAARGGSGRRRQWNISPHGKIVHFENRLGLSTFSPAKWSMIRCSFCGFRSVSSMSATCSKGGFIRCTNFEDNDGTHILHSTSVDPSIVSKRAARAFVDFARRPSHTSSVSFPAAL